MVRPVIRVAPYGEEGGYGPVSFESGKPGSSAGRRLMSKVPSLVFDMDMEQEGGLPAARSSASLAESGDVQDVLQRIASLTEPWGEAEYMLLLHVRFAREDAAKRGAPLTVAELADTLRRLGYNVRMRTALGGGWGSTCLRNLRHSFLTVGIQGSQGEGPATYVVDPRFREQFEIAHATPRYERCLAALGPEVVGSQDRLGRLVELMCREMAAAFAESGTPLPPWRQQAAMMSKWQPRRSEEVLLGPMQLAPAVANAAGALSPAGARAPARQRGWQQESDGQATAAQRLSMTGRGSPSHGATPPSPISEGLEGQEQEGWSPPSSNGSDAGESYHLDLLGTDEFDSDCALQRDEPAVASAAVAVGAAVTPLPAGSRAVPVQHVWDGMRAATAALPTRRNTWA